ncbi:MAG TPA: hypothetical protein VJI71_03410 [Candidatus Norongarragalinales archaeon]|nr:hypothetical protein [Candidatus Norongarragalinales archaeon]
MYHSIVNGFIFILLAAAFLGAVDILTVGALLAAAYLVFPSLDMLSAPF